MKNRKIKILFLVSVLGISVMSGCGNTTKNSGNRESSQESEKLDATIYWCGINGTVTRTTDGVNWEKVTLPSNDDIDSSQLKINGIDYVNGEYILYAEGVSSEKYSSSFPILYNSSNGIDWELLTPEYDKFQTPQQWIDLDYVNEKYYITSQKGGMSTRKIYCGETINLTENMFKNNDDITTYEMYVKDYAYGDDKFVVHMGRDKFYWEDENSIDKYFYVSTDGQDFEKVETEIDLVQIEFGNNVFVGIGTSNAEGFYKSNDGVNWTKTFEVKDSSVYYGLIYKDEHFYIWYKDTIYISSDGDEWNEFYKNPDGEDIIEFDCQNGVFAYSTIYSGVGETQSEREYRVFVSSDGENWIDSAFEIDNYDFSTLYILEN